MTPKERASKWRANNRERHRAYSRKYYQEHREDQLEKSLLYQSEHKTQHNEITKKWHKAHPDYKKTYHHFRRYKITPEDYQRILDEQNGECAICGLPEQKNGKHGRLGIDHCHETGIVRGLLCINCNLMLGGAKDNIETLINAVSYLEGKKKCQSEAA